jgi:flagellar motor protein MotB
MPPDLLPCRHQNPQTDLDSVGDNYYISLSDLMVGLLFIFLILLTYFALESRVYEQENEWLKKLKVSAEGDRSVLVQAAMQNQHLEQRLHGLEEQLTNTDQLRADLLRRVRSELIQRGVAVETDEERGVLRLPQDMLFDAGSATLRARGIEALHQVAEVLQGAVTDPALADRLESIYIEGHTDNLPIRTSQYRDNLSLSAARAMNTYQTLVQFAPELPSLANSQNQPLFGISGYGDLRPIGDNGTEEGRERNRRIDFRFVMAAPKLQQPATGTPSINTNTN